MAASLVFFSYKLLFLLLHCGVTRYGNASERIVGGRLASRGEFPWQLSLELNHPQKGTIPHFCGGVLIDKQWILTAAHCVVNPMFVLPHPTYWKARVGEHNLKEWEDSEKKIAISQIFYYPWYHGYDNDIALMKLAEPVPENSHIKPICLPKETDTFLGQQFNCLASGWGKVDFSSKASDDLRAVGLQIFDNSKCIEYTNKFRIPIQPWHLCAGTLEGGKGTCQIKNLKSQPVVGKPDHQLERPDQKINKSNDQEQKLNHQRQQSKSEAEKSKAHLEASDIQVEELGYQAENSDLRVEEISDSQGQKLESQIKKSDFQIEKSDSQVEISNHQTEEWTGKTIFQHFGFDTYFQHFSFNTFFQHFIFMSLTPTDFQVDKPYLQFEKRIEGRNIEQFIFMSLIPTLLKIYGSLVIFCGIISYFRYLTVSSCAAIYVTIYDIVFVVSTIGFYKFVIYFVSIYPSTAFLIVLLSILYYHLWYTVLPPLVLPI
ncbi:uncharacterized protein LOC118193261 isoform X2 [Stegodyphus dumicola]|uniref:uncharacterized protein LOC118193261 isoform X2 n=1 Tax=Stegodyphus dumicola TaxID=202533 RepID=UPI0015AFD9D1|nr:uncharacterized protein LOC118193261 isoform X2 [Stegodyphus dumicola]